MEVTPKLFVEKAKDGALSELLRDFVHCRQKVIIIDGRVSALHASHTWMPQRDMRGGCPGCHCLRCLPNAPDRHGAGGHAVRPFEAPSARTQPDVRVLPPCGRLCLTCRSSSSRMTTR